MPSAQKNAPPALTQASPEKIVAGRIQAKMRDYAAYSFTAPQSCAINIFFDLAQEFDDPDHYHLLPVLVLKLLFDMEAELFVRNSAGELALCTPRLSDIPIPVEAVLTGPHWDGKRCLLPVRGKNPMVSPDGQDIFSEGHLSGVLAVYTAQPVNSHELLFLNKFANRVGFSLHNKHLAQRNEQHILFVRKLAHDIGHNIITPNLHFKLLLRQLEGQMKTLEALCREEASGRIQEKLRSLQEKMGEQLQTILKHFSYSAMFLESLLRQSHFDEGHYVLRCAPLDLLRRVILPQLERYRSRLQEKGILLEAGPAHAALHDCMVSADVGLVSQVFANMLANAVKYCTPSPLTAKRVARWDAMYLPNFFTELRPGVKVSLYTTGPPISAHEAVNLFQENFRASNAAGQYGTGHGLFFVREIIAAHGGATGYEAAEDGNIFYFVLPCAQ